MTKKKGFTPHLLCGQRQDKISLMGFTLIELLIVIGIIAILAGIIYVAVDPARRLAEARNAERWSSVNSILNAYLKYTVDNAGTEPVSLTAGVYNMIGTGASATGCETTPNPASSITTTAVANLDALATSGYLASMPYDPKTSGADATKTYYYIIKSSVGRITVGACDPEEVAGTAPTIVVSR